MFWEKLKNEDVRLISFERKGRFDFFDFFRRLKLFMQEEKFAVVQTFLPVANFFGIYAAEKAGIKYLFASIRASNMDFSRYSLGSRVYFYLSRWAINKYARRVVYNSYSGKSHHQAIGFWKDAVVIPNAIDMEEIARVKNNTDRALKKKEIGIPESSKIICSAARLDPKKGHTVLLEAFSLLAHSYYDLYLLIIGEGNQDIKNSVNDIISSHNLQERVKILGAREDVYELIYASDILVSPSIFGEGLSNSVMEAMSLGTPAIATDVGDHARVLDEERGLVVSPQNAFELKNAIERLLQDPALPLRISKNAYSFAQQQFCLDRMVNDYLATWGI